MKACINCFLPQEDENFPFFKENNGNLKRRNVCKVCRNKQKYQSKLNLGQIKGENEDFYSKNYFTKVKLIHKNIYDYSKSIYKGARSKIIIICSQHGEFEQRASAHLGGQGCFKCYNSKGEQLIYDFLSKENIEFEQEKSFDKRFYFDFYLPKLNLCIEYNGEQHYQEVNYFGNSLIKTKERDKLKRELMKKLNISLLIIPFNKRNKIEEIIKGFIQYRKTFKGENITL